MIRLDLRERGRKLRFLRTQEERDMLYLRRKGWEIAESRVTPEHLFLNRRSLLAGAAALAARWAVPAAWVQQWAGLQSDAAAPLARRSGAPKLGWAPR